MSVASLDQGCTGISCPRDALGFCLCLEFEYFIHTVHNLKPTSSWSFKPGQYTVSLALSLHLPRPKCPSCMSCSVAWHFFVWYYNPGALQNNTIFNGQLFSEGPIRLYLAWHFSDGTWPSMLLWYAWVVQAHHLLMQQFSSSSSCHFWHLTVTVIGVLQRLHCTSPILVQLVHKKIFFRREHKNLCKIALFTATNL